MAVTNLTISGAFNGHTGIVSVPSSFPGDVTAAGSLNQALQGYLDNLSASIQGVNYSFENNDVAVGLDYVATVSAAAGGLEEFTNTDSVGGVSSVSANGAYTVSTGVTDVAVQAPGNVTLAGNGTTRFALFGANSNVNYVQSTGGSASIVAAGGNDSIYVSAPSVNDTVWSAGNDTVKFNGVDGNEQINAQGNATTSVFIGGSDVATVTASDSAQTTVVFLQNAGGNLDFINNSSQAQTVYSGSYTTSGGGSIYAPNSVTVNAGAGGGFYVGGRAGNNSLIGGSGAVTLQGAGTGDTLIGNGVSNNLFGGTGLETLIGSSSSTNNIFQIGLQYVGIGQVTASGVVSTNGSGNQNFIIGNTNGETVTGSTVAGSYNLYDVVGSSSGNLTTGGSTLTITNFGANSAIYLTDASLTGTSDTSIYSITTANGPGGGTDIYLNDGTTILLKGVNVSHVYSTTLQGATGVITAIGYK